MMRPTFLPFIFDSKPAWEKTISDPRWNHNMSFSDFMEIYLEHRNGKSSSFAIKEEPIKEIKAQILDQSEIDKLLEEFSKR